MKYELVIFDMDGTTLYTLQDLTDCMNMSLEKSGLPPRNIEEIRKIVGNGIHSEVEHSVPIGTSDEVIEQVYEDFLDLYRMHQNDTTRPYDGICTLLQVLKESGIHTAIVSNKADHAVKELMEIYFPGLIEIGVGERSDIQRKPAPDSVLNVIETMGIAKQNTVYIGDSEVDVQTAKNAGIDCIGVTWGYRDEDALIGSTIIVDTVDALQAYLLG